MQFKGSFKQKYTLDKELKELVVYVELRQVDGLLKPRQNVFYGIAKVNDKEYHHPDLQHCVNAQFMAESIGLQLISDMKIKYKNEGKIFRLKRK